MAEIKLTKNELRTQQQRLAQLDKYLPTLQLKKGMLQIEVNLARQEIISVEDLLSATRTAVEEYCALLSEKTSIDLDSVAVVTNVNKRYDNIAGVEIPYFVGVQFEELEYSLFDTPPWVDAAIDGIRRLAEVKEQLKVAKEKKQALENELRSVSIRVNLFEKILIPRAKTNIKKIKVFLGDQALVAVSRAKSAKNKIESSRISSERVLFDEMEESYAH